MEWRIYSFSAERFVSDAFTDYADASAYFARMGYTHPHQVVFHRGTTEEDIKFVGDEWECSHVLGIGECIYCDPTWIGAELKNCSECCADAPTAQTWHKSDGTCGACRKED